MQKCAIGVGTFIAGMILTFADFPQDAAAGKLDSTILDQLALFYMLAILLIGITGILILRHFPISRESHNERLRVLNEAAKSAS